jgi:phosphopantothenoylcysteine decarboxylase / phosphopantothenate---cysteine ligase
MYNFNDRKTCRFFIFMLQGKNILLAVTGSIAAYKSATIVRLLVKAGAEVKVIMTEAATNFIPALTMSTLSKNAVLTHLFEENTWANHVMLGRWADVMVVAPATCNTLAKMANGICDNLLQAIYLSATCPVMIAPAMDEDMWYHQSTKRNLLTLEQYGNIILPVDDGELASGLSGKGRMAEPEVIIKMVETFLNTPKELTNKNVLITAGPTYEQIDPVRFIGNNSSGKMGIALANECILRGASVTLVLGPTSEKIPKSVNVINVKSAAEMYAVCVEKFIDVDIAIMSAAVADYTPVVKAVEKIKKNEATFSIELKKTDDILKKLGSIKRENQLLVGFALETENEKENAIKKLNNKNADFIVLNSLKDAGAGFGHNTNKITIFDKAANEFSFETKTKEKVAIDIINVILKNKYE